MAGQGDPRYDPENGSQAMARTAERHRSEVAHKVSRLGPKEVSELRDFTAFLGRTAVMERRVCRVPVDLGVTGPEIP